MLGFALRMQFGSPVIDIPTGHSRFIAYAKAFENFRVRCIL